MPNVEPIAYYEEVARARGAEAARADRAARVASWLRLALAAATVGALLRGAPWPGLVAAAGFVAVAWWHRRTVERADVARRRAAAARGGRARAARHWAEMPAVRAVAPADGWPAALARDLDVTSGRCLTRLVDVVHPAVGGRRLLDWLLGDPPAVETIRDRQASVAALRERPALLVEIVADARHGDAPATAGGLAAVRAWCEAGESRVAWLPRALSVACVLAAVVAFVLGGASAVERVAAPLLVVQLALAAAARRRLQRELPRVDAALPQIAGVVRVLASLHRATDVAGRLGGIQRRLRAEHAVSSLAALARLLAWNETRRSPMAHWALNAAGGFDVHLAHAFSRWRRDAGPRAAAWLDLAADAEALVALATLAFENPRWTMPAVRNEPAPPLDARGLAHPLLAADVAVPNDAALAAPGDVAVVSGANMAGKTTFLRAIGLNVLLAQAGGPVCADDMVVRRSRVRSSVRVDDDLGRGASLFLAEATRLRDVIRDAEDGGAPVLFLFDEILHGTNAADRLAATRVVLRRLARAGAAGVVTTHDPAVGEVGDGAGAELNAPRQLHFAGSVRRDAGGGLALVFDYRVREGPAREANARQVLEMLGIA
ncbi:DNA mismatch repair protein MutS domain protein [Gemmatirosa kalamazoonensis]|uniref:DNA mismatch repair protein MutS domain protein n=1 Tax=Gemmatirosa kalamazoonensis TaxID=861299 RepID=W0RHK9_9BACT|nr:hypothetical protein [Gemmatirosa kalamazoonensis]AHG88888.1 DNA mismatch repair protein MutS domain protein [Gemmatirosa kalamazoonensis]